MATSTKASLSFYTFGATSEYNSGTQQRPLANADLGCDTTLKILRVGDGTTRGGIPVPTAQNFFSQVNSGGNITLGNHYVYIANGGSTVTLPNFDASSCYHGWNNNFYGRRYLIVHSGSGADVTITGPSNFEFYLSTNQDAYSSVEVISTGSAWVVISTGFAW